MDNSGCDAQDPQATDSDSEDAPPDGPSETSVDNSGGDAHEPEVNVSDSDAAPPDRPEGGGAKAEEPLIQLLQQLNKDHGTIKTAKRLGVDRKTVWRALRAGRLTPWLRTGLDRERQAAELAAEREAGDEHPELELRVEGLEQRLQDVKGQLAGGLIGLREDLTGLRNEVKTLAWTRPGGDGSEADARGLVVRSPHRTYPQVVTVEPLPDDEQVFGEAMPLVAEWREQRARFKAHWPLVEGLEAEVRMLELELELIEECRLTLPPGQLPWEWDQRGREARRREQRLGTARSNLKRARWRRWIMRLMTAGLRGR